MTLAICTQCGESKLGAFTTCRECGFHASDVRDLAKALMLTDHYFSHADLHQIASRIKSGEEMHYDEACIAEQVSSLESDPVFLDKLLHPEKYPPSLLARIGCMVLPIGVCFLMIILVVLALIRFFTT